MSKSNYRCACCGRQLPYAHRTVVDTKTGRDKVEEYGRWIVSSWTRQRFCWPGECKTDRRPRAARKAVTA